MGLQNPDCGFEPHPACQKVSMNIYTYSSFVADVEVLGNQIKKDSIKFNCINCITRGGLALTAWLSQYIEIREIYTSGGKFVDDQFVYASKINELVNGNVLVISDLCRSGEIISKIVGDLQSNKNVKLVKVACIHYYPETSIIKPDYYAEAVFSDIYLKYPWEQ